MIQEIRIQDLGVIADATVDLHPGLTVLTGETGAGKTMLVSSIELLLGARSDAGLVREGATESSIDAVLEVEEPSEASIIAKGAGARLEDGLLPVSRVVRAGGRSRAHAGGRTIPVGTLGEITRGLVALHGQADQWRLRRASEHREVLDLFGGEAVAAARSEYDQARARWTGLRDELAELTASESGRRQELDALTYQLEQIDSVDPTPGEDHALREESERLGHADDLRVAALQAHGALSGGDLPEHPDAAALTAEAERALDQVLDRDRRLTPLRDRVAEVRTLLIDVAADLSGYAADIEVDPERLDAVHERRARLTALTRRYGEDIDAVLAHREGIRSRLLELQQADDRLDGMAEQVAAAEAEVAEAAEELTRARSRAAEVLAQRVAEELAHLAMPDASVSVVVGAASGDESDRVPGPRGPIHAGPHGADRVEIMLAANPGSPPRSVAQAASGGELSRIMLALEVAVADSASSMPTFVFDEVDAGVGGRAGLDVGARLQALARRSQVLVVTHLAQVAAHADRHLVVRKTTDGRVTASDVHEVTGSDRLVELSRMMGGADSSAGLTHAEELLESCQAGRTPNPSADAATG